VDLSGPTQLIRRLSRLAREISIVDALAFNAGAFAGGTSGGAFEIADQAGLPIVCCGSATTRGRRA